MIFLHSSFRVSSTWLWSRFRSKDEVVAYYEVFHEQLAIISRDHLTELNPESWPSKHPPGPPYFLEFLPLMKEAGGIEKFEPAMAFDLFIPSGGIGGAISKAEKAYLGSLMAQAEGQGKIPLLSCKRGLGRMRAIKSAFPGFHILAYRNLFQQWCSYTSQYLSGQPFFFCTIRKTIEANQHDPFLKRLRDLFPLDDVSIESSKYFHCFLLLHLYLYAQVADSADLVIDVNRIAVDDAYRTDIERQIIEKTGVAVDLSDAKNTIAFSVANLGRFEDVVCELEALGDLVIASAPSSTGREIVCKCLADVISEYKQYDFYARALAAECSRLSSERDNLVLERDALRSRLEFGQGINRRLRAPLRAVRNLFSQGQSPAS
jgi:hypothetical protein